MEFILTAVLCYMRTHIDKTVCMITALVLLVYISDIMGDQLAMLSRSEKVMNIL